MDKKKKRSRMFYKYTLIFFLSIILIAGNLLFLMFYYTTNMLTETEIRNSLANMTLAANDMENQFNILRGISGHIVTDVTYRPRYIEQDAPKQVSVLKAFSQFRNYSVYSQEYFLMYPDLGKLFTSNGAVAYFEYYAPHMLNISADETEALSESILSQTKASFQYVNGYTLFIIPIRFGTTNYLDARATLVFIISATQMNERLHQVAAGFPDRYTITCDGLPLTSELADAQGSDAAHPMQLSVSSPSGMVTLQADMNLSRWDLLNAQSPQFLFLLCFAGLVAVSFVSFILAGITLKPLRRILSRYRKYEPGEKNEFEQLDQILLHMEHTNNLSLDQLRNQLIIQILRGFYSEQLIERWSAFHINFDKDCSCVFVIDAPSIPEQEIGEMIHILTTESDADFCLYTAYLAEERNLAVIATFNGGVTVESIISHIRVALYTWNVSIYAGEICATPKHLSVSYMQALTALHYDGSIQKEFQKMIEPFAERFVALTRKGEVEMLNEVGEELKAQMKSFGSNGLLVKHYANELINAISQAAMQQDLSLDRHALSMLVLLPDIDVLIHDLLSLLHTCAQDADASNLPRSNTGLAIVEFVNASAFDPNFDLANVSKKFEFSADYVSTLIKKETGVGFKEYVTRLRIEETKRLLLSRTDLSVNEISEMVGYRKASNLIRKFKEVTGCTPTQFR